MRRLATIAILLLSCGGNPEPAPSSPTPPVATTPPSSAKETSSSAKETSPATFIKKSIGFLVHGEAFGKPSPKKPETSETVALHGRVRYFHIVCTIDVAAKKRACIDVATKRSPAETKNGAEHFDNWTKSYLSKCFDPALTPMPKAALDALNQGQGIARALFGPGEVPLVYVAYVETTPKEVKWSWETWTPSGKFDPGSHMTAENILALAGYPRGTVTLPLLFPADGSGTLDPRFSAVEVDKFGEFHPGFDRVKQTLKVLDSAKVEPAERDLRIAILFDRAVLLAVLGDKALSNATSELENALSSGPVKHAELASTLNEGMPILKKMSKAPYLVTNPCGD